MDVSQSPIGDRNIPPTLPNSFTFLYLRLAGGADVKCSDSLALLMKTGGYVRD